MVALVDTYNLSAATFGTPRPAGRRSATTTTDGANSYAAVFRKTDDGTAGPYSFTFSGGSATAVIVDLPRRDRLRHHTRPGEHEPEHGRREQWHHPRPGERALIFPPSTVRRRAISARHVDAVPSRHATRGDYDAQLSSTWRTGSELRGGATTAPSAATVQPGGTASVTGGIVAIKGISILTATVSNTSASTMAAVTGQIAHWRTTTETSTSVLATPTGQTAHWRTTTETSASTDTASAVKVGPRTTTDTSLSSMSAMSFGPGILIEHSVSQDSIPTIRRNTGTTITFTSLSAMGVPVGMLLAFSSDTSTSTMTVATGYAPIPKTTSEISLSWDSANSGGSAPGYVLIRERAPLRLTVKIETPSGQLARWAVDDPNPANVPNGLNFSSVWPGGFEQGTCTLQRDPGLRLGISSSQSPYPDLQEYSRATILGVGGEVAHQGRIEDLPDTGGDQAQVAPTWLGYQAALDDNESAMEIFVHQQIGDWQGPSVARQIYWAGRGITSVGSPTVTPDPSTSFPALCEEMSGSWTASQLVEGWFDSHHIPLGRLYSQWKTKGVTLNSGGFSASMFLCTDDTGASYDALNSLSSPGGGSLNGTAARYWALMQFSNMTSPGGQDGSTYDLFWPGIAVYGAHGLPTYGASPPYGVLASDVIAYVVNKWCPTIGYSTGANGSIQPSSFVIPHLAFLSPTKVSDMIKSSLVFEAELGWGVWEGPQNQPWMYLRPSTQPRRRWTARVGPAQLQSTGVSATRSLNGVIVGFTDTGGFARSIGPPGSGADQTSSLLLDPDPTNPANQTTPPLKKWQRISMGTSTYSGALAVGQNFLQEMKLLDTSGQAALVGHVQDINGVYWPSWAVRAGDVISFPDSNSVKYRRIVHTAYDDVSKTNTIQLDQPPDSLDALLQKLSVVLTPYGLRLERRDDGWT